MAAENVCFKKPSQEMETKNTQMLVINNHFIKEVSKNRIEKIILKMDKIK
jgi:hypothetical protein